MLEARKVAIAVLGAWWVALTKTGDRLVLAEGEEVKRAAFAKLSSVGIAKLRSELISRGRRDLAKTVSDFNAARRIPAHPGSLAAAVSMALDKIPLDTSIVQQRNAFLPSGCSSSEASSYIGDAVAGFSSTDDRAAGAHMHEADLAAGASQRYAYDLAADETAEKKCFDDVFTRREFRFVGGFTTIF